MTKSLNKLLVQRYWKYLLLVVIVISGMAFMDAFSGIKNWQAVEQNQSRPEEREYFESRLKDDDTEVPGKVAYYDFKSGEEKFTDDFEEYKKSELQFTVRSYNTEEYAVNEFYSESSFYLVIILMVVGFLSFFLDLKTHFNTLLFSSRFTRKDIFIRKKVLISGTLLVTLLLTKLIGVWVLKLAIPSEHFLVDMGPMMISVVTSTITLMTVYEIFAFAGMIMGEWVTAIGTLVAFWFSLPMASDAIDRLVIIVKHYILGYSMREIDQGSWLDNGFVTYLNDSPFDMKNVILLLVVIAILIISAIYLYNKMGLDNNNEYLVFNGLKRPIQWVMISYITVILATTGITDHLYVSNIEFSWIGFALKVAFSLVLSYLLSQGLIYRKFKLGTKSIDLTRK
ncbi:hypothetical protein OL233_11110 [Vagococcus sp. PNs007]|uniref:ABC transporter permease n=1 Tax=Vagococcus proximus TaxID=2991417 RepID=A0ABT5X499_9ENTE|nr:hypothetical protein [Vagococcus proximus]MDF0480828.1 hypothetical protein [Vagococcus proximus]